MKNKIYFLAFIIGLIVPYALQAFPRIVVFGDSHARYCFSNFDQLKYVYPYNDTLNVQFFITELGPKTMYSFGRDGAKAFNLRHLGVVEGDVVIFTLGEIDVRGHIVPQRDNKGRDLNEILDQLVTRYIKTITKNKARYNNIICVVMEVMPPTDSCYNPAFPFVGTLADRVAINHELNRKLKDCCDQNNILFLPIHDIYAAPDGTLIPELSDNCVHVNPKSNYHIKRRIIELLLEQ